MFLLTKSWKNHPQKLLRKTQIHFFFLTASTAQMAQTEEFMFQIVACRPTVYKTGIKTKKNQKSRIFLYSWSLLFEVTILSTHNKWNIQHAKKLFLGLNSSSGSCELVEDFPVPREDSTKVLTAFYYNQIKEGKKWRISSWPIFKDFSILFPPQKVNTYLDQASDVPSTIFSIISCKILFKNPINLFLNSV